MHIHAISASMASQLTTVSPDSFNKQVDILIPGTAKYYTMYLQSLFTVSPDSFNKQVDILIPGTAKYYTMYLQSLFTV